MVIKQKKIENAETAKKMIKIYKPIMIVSIVIGAVLALLSKGEGGLFTASLVPMFVAIFAFVKYSKGKTELKRIENTACKSCGTKFKFPDNVKYTIKNTSSSTSNVKNQIKKTTKTNVEITCKCPKCAKENKFDWTFITEEAILNALGAVLERKTYALEDWVEDLFQ